MKNWGAGGMRIHGPGHGDGSGQIAEAVFSLVLYRSTVDFFMPGANPPPWIMKLFITR